MSSYLHLIDQRRLIGLGGSTVSGSIYFYYSGTSVLAPIYQDPGLTIPSVNPLEVGAGQVVPNVYLDSNLTYKRRIVYSDGTVDEQDPLGFLFSGDDLGIPVGTVIDYPGPTIPSGYLLCAGQEVSRATYADLFAAIGTTYGAGNGSTTFNIPDLRGRIVAGKDNMGGIAANRLSSIITGTTLGATGGVETVTLDNTQIPSHTHTGTTNTAGTHTHQIPEGAATPGGGTLYSSGDDMTNVVATYSTSQAAGDHTHTFTTGGTGGGLSHSNVQPSIIFNKVIKATATTALSLINLMPSFDTKANADALGILPTATNMGTFTGGTIPNNVSAKEGMQALETALETLPTYTALTNVNAAGLIGYNPSSSYSVNTVGHALKYNLALTPADFADLLPSGTLGIDDTAAFVALANAYYTKGRAVHIPDLGFPYIVSADSVNFTPPASYNSDNKRPPAITADPSAIIKAKTGGQYLIKLGTTATDYSGYLRNGEFNLPVLHDGGYAFSKAVLYVPFFIDCIFNYRVVVTASQRGAWFGDTTAPSASAGVKGHRDYDRDLGATSRTVQSITNAANPVVTFATAHGLWPSAGNRVVCLNFTGTLGSWSAINNQSLDCTVLSATQIQLKNVDTTTYGSLPGTTTAYLNMASMRVSKQIAGVTNANPCIITTTIPHLLTTGDTVDVAEIFQMPTLVGQFTATVLSPTTFSVAFDTTSLQSWSSFGHGWVMQWVPFASCDIAEYHDNSTDVDDSQFFSRHYRIHQYHNPATCGWDGKKQGGHFYNFPESGEQLCAYYLGGDNNCVQVQSDGPFRYVFWAFGPRNASTQCSTNVYINAKDSYGALVRTESGAEWNCYLDRLKSNSLSTRIFTDHVGLGAFTCERMIYNSVAAPSYEYGTRNIAAFIRFVGSTGTISSNFQVNAVTRTGTGVYTIDFVRPVPLDAIMLVGSGTSNSVITEDESYGSRSVYKRQIECFVGGVATDPSHVNIEWRYP